MQPSLCRPPGLRAVGGLPNRWLTHTGSSYAALRAKTKQPLPRCASIGLQPGGRNFSARVRKPPDAGHVNNR
jgi:hypothetical protein